MKTIYFSIFILSFILVFPNFGKSQGVYEFQGMVKNYGQPIPAASVVVWLRNAKFLDLKTNSRGYFKASLSLNEHYTIDFKYPGSVVKKIQITTKVPDSKKDKKLESDLFEIDFFPGAPKRFSANLAINPVTNSLTAASDVIEPETKTITQTTQNQTTTQELKQILEKKKAEARIDSIKKAENSKQVSNSNQQKNNLVVVNKPLVSANKNDSTITRKGKPDEFLIQSLLFPYNFDSIKQVRKKELYTLSQTKQIIEMLRLDTVSGIDVQALLGKDTEIQLLLKSDQQTYFDSLHFLNGMLALKRDLLKGAKHVLQVVIYIPEGKVKNSKIEVLQSIIVKLEQEIIVIKDEILRIDSQLQIKEKELEAKNITIYALLAGSFLLVIVLIVLYINYRIKKRNNNILIQKNDLIFKQKEEIETQRDQILEKNEILYQQKEEILTQNEDILDKNQILTQQQLEITQSINYASRIQRALLPDEGFFKCLLPDYFVLYKPLHIVSGDFYWVKQIKNQTVIAVADCTGHGIPGAFMSIMGINFLNQIISEKNFDKPDLVLNQLRTTVLSSFSHNDSISVHDGMDIALCSINRSDKTIAFAAAFSSMIKIREHEIELIKGDRMPVGYYEKMNDFSKQTIGFEPGDMFYLFSDGYSDQTGGEENKKFLMKNFRNSLLEVSALPFAEQKNELEKIHRNWKNKTEQVDDILVMGFKL